MQISHHPHLPRYGSSLLVELAAERDQVLARVRPRAVEHGQSDVAVAHPAQQRARPHRHPPRLQGRQRLHHQPQHRRHAGGHRGDGGIAHRRGRPRARGWPRRPDRAADGALLSRRRPAGEGHDPAVRRAPRRQPVRRRRGGAALETEASARQRGAAILGEVLGGGSATDAQGLLAIRDDGDALARAIETGARRRRPAPCRRRHDRRARQRHAAIGRLRGRGDSPRLRRRARRRRPLSNGRSAT